jgi:uncharacterized OsmC-like protein
MSEQHGFTIHLEQVQDFEFKVKFDWEGNADLLMDEPEPMGGGAGPNASRVLAAAVANCLTASLFFCLKKSRVEVEGLTASVSGVVARNEQKRLRIQGYQVRIVLPEGVEEGARGLERCLGLFEDYCLVTASVRSGIPVRVEVVNHSGEQLHLGGDV